mmetsp:Transcript_30070/g.72171  ORF Transcript_30070/g.72171 Transcript_30070/m.72171 type:complete len:478 (-) Transcript_30070:348-1781(-)|eukprot:CAMPEP_0113641762 /NCGR_PEP_ID=MMETSP0017_2-20120614/21934_1 /TAXON_ID=2856 /ORGANISM="Cylindrotheca closterium" /LENGTH=477 /DNA_ID=CAMNT_0000553141 /DNA_START=94 /DNA_END=1527 /DNA_ORIENTATION=+ /assembly_acc=CAM_ASM_000147
MTVLPSMNGRLAPTLSRLSARRVSASSTARNAIFCASHLSNSQSNSQLGFSTTTVDMDSTKRTKSTAATALATNAHCCIDIPLSRAYAGNPSIVLERASRETQVMLPLVQFHEKEAQRAHEQQDSQESLQFAMNAAETLLKATQSTADLAEAIQNASIQKQPQIVSIHRTLLTVSQLCVSLMMANNKTNREFEALSMEHPLLDYILQLSLRAHDLGLGFHLPLYQGICQAIASQENSIHSPSSWILNMAEWAQLELGHLPNNFFEESLLELTKRQRSNETVSILQGMKELHQQTSSLNDKTTKEILLNMKGSIRSMYQKQKSTWTLEEEHCREIILLLESSIWKLVDEEQQHIIDRPSILQDAIEVILNHTEQDLPSESCTFQTDDLEEFLFEATELVDTLEEQLDYEDVEGTDMPLDDPSLLYTRPIECNDVPDITSQLLVGSKNKSLRYSPDMERHIYFQFCPMDKDDDDGDTLY